MCNVNKCRVCLMDGAKLPIFESDISKESLHAKLFQCFKEQIEDIEGYPRNICESCNDTLHLVCNFLTKYKTSCKLLETMLIDVKKEVCSDNEPDDNDMEILKDEIELKICKTEPNLNCIESLGDSTNIPLACEKKLYTNLTEIKTKLKSLKEIEFKRKPAKKNICKTVKKAIKLEAELESNGKSKSNKLKEPNKEKLGEQTCMKQNQLKPLTDCLPKLCDKCGEIFKSHKRMAEHKKSKHSEESVKCPQCPQSSHVYTKHNLNRHIKAVHKEKKFICDTCGKGFALRSPLTVHIKTVHAEFKKTQRNHVCKHCSKAYTVVKALIIHERSAHTGIRPAQCSVCGANFYHEDYLREHMRLHTGETPFKCPICGRGYAQRGNMRSHISHNHRLADLSAVQIKNLRPSWFKYLKKT